MAKLRVLASSALRSLTITLQFTAGNTPLLLKDKLSNTDKGTMGRKVEACLGGAVEINEQKLHHRNQGPCSPELKVLSFFSDLNTLKQPVSAAEFHPAQGHSCLRWLLPSRHLRKKRGHPTQHFLPNRAGLDLSVRPSLPHMFTKLFRILTTGLASFSVLALDITSVPSRLRHSSQSAGTAGKLPPGRERRR